MKARSFSLCILFLCFFIGRADAYSCQSFFDSTELHNQLTNFNLLAKSDLDVWNGYNLSDELVILTDLRNAPQCYVIITNGEVVRLGTLREPIKIKNTIYDFIYFKNDNLPEPFKLEMADRNKKEAIVVSIHSWEFIPAYIRALVGENGLIFSLIVHEGFHLFYQYRFANNRNSNFSWPRWVKSPGHEDIVENCYKDPKVFEIYNQELNALVRSAQLMYILKNKPAALDAAQDFISLREKRYKIATDNNIRVPIFDDEYSISCELAESSLEIDEGITNFIGSEVALELGLINDFQFIEYSKLYEFNPYFYGAAQLQLYLLKAIFPKHTFDKLRTSLSESPDFSVNVFSLFKDSFHI